MKQSYIFLANGFEEVEALGTVDVIRRAGMTISTVSINSTREVTGAHGIEVRADKLLSEVELTDSTEWLICPGGMPGATNLHENGRVGQLLKEHYSKGGLTAAICASPAVVLGPLGILAGHKATAYPGFEPIVTTETEMTGQPVVEDGNLITANGPANTFAFALAIVTKSLGAEEAGKVAAGMLIK